MSGGYAEIIFLILFIMFLRRVILTIRRSQSQLPKEGGAGRRRLPGKAEQPPEFEWEQSGSLTDYEWPDEFVSPRSDPRKTASKQQAFISAPAAKEPAAEPAMTWQEPGAEPGFITPFNTEFKFADVADGIIWSQILGPRGGLQRNKRR